MKALTASLLILAALPATAAPADSVDTGALLRRIDAATTPLARHEQQAFTPNPASMFYLMPFSLSDFRIKGASSASDEAYVVQEGKGALAGTVDASSYLRLDRRTTVWGAASFTTGKRRSILWNNSSDYRLVAPYILGDSVGGDLSSRTYSFSGGYAGKSRRWTWGAEASYRAAIDYRNRDPRDKITVSDLAVKGGATLLTGRYIIGLGGHLRVYNQESDVDFYNPNNDIRTYLLTGLGNYYARFSGNSSGNTAYKGLGYGATAQLLPASGTGFSLSATFGKLRMTQVLRDYNNLDLTRADTYTLSLRTSYTLRIGKVSTGILLSADAMRRPGYENIFGTSVGSNYTRIGTRRNYLHDMAETTLAIPVSFDPSERVTLHIVPAVSGTYSHEEYRRPLRTLEAHSFTPSLDVRAVWRSSRRMSWGIEAGAARRLSDADRRNLPGLSTESSLGKTVRHNFDMLTSDLTAARASLSATWLMQPSMALKVSAEGSITTFQGHGDGRQGAVTAAIIF